MPTVLIDNHSDIFIYSWKVYSGKMLFLRKLAEKLGIRQDEVYLPSNSGSRETAWQRWKKLLKEVKFNDGESLTENILANAVELYADEKQQQAEKFRRVCMPQMSVFLNLTPKNDRDLEILDYIRTAKEKRDEQ